MSDIQQTTYPDDVVYPKCAKCRATMVLKRLRPGKFYCYTGKFECQTCGYTVREVVKLRQTSSPPLASAIDGRDDLA